MLNGVTVTNSEDNNIFIPYHAIDIITIEPERKLKKTKKSQLISSQEWEKTGKWKLYIETIRGNKNYMVFNTKEEARLMLEKVKENISFSVEEGQNV